MGKIPFYNGFAGRDSGFAEKRRVFLHDDSHAAPAVAEAEEASKPQLPKSEIDSLSAVEKEALKSFIATSEAETKFGNGVSNVDVGTLDVVKYVTESTRSQIHHIESNSGQLLDLRVTEQLRKRIAEIEGLNPEDKTHAKKINKAVKKYNSRERINAEIAKLTKQINNLDDGLFNPEILYPQSIKEQKAVLQVKLDRLKELAKSETENRAEETKKMAFTQMTSAESLEGKFRWLDNPTEAKWNRHPEYLKLKGFLPPSEISGWRKNEKMRVLLFHLGKSANYRQILDGKPVKLGGTEITTHFGEDTGEAAEIGSQIKSITEEVSFKEMNAALAGLEISDDEIKKPEELAIKVSNIKKYWEEGIINAEVASQEAEAVLGVALEKDPEYKRAVKAFEKAKKDLEVIQKKIEELKKEKQDASDKLAMESSKSKKERNPTQIKFWEDRLIRIDGELSQLEATTGIKELAATQAEEAVENKEKDFSDNQKKDIVENKKTAATKKKELQKLQATEEKFSPILDKLVDLTKRKEEAKKSSEKTATYSSAGELFTSLEVELAKADMCRRVGRKDTADLSNTEKAEAEKIGRLSANMKLVDWSSENQKAENAIYLNRLAERNKGWMREKVEGAASLGKGLWGLIKKDLGRSNSMEIAGRNAKTAIGDFKKTLKLDKGTGEGGAHHT